MFEATSSRPRPFGRTGGHEGRCHPRTRFARGSPSPSRSRGGRWLRPRRSTLRYIIAVAPLRTDSGPRRPRSSPNTLRTRFAVSDRSRGERALRPRRRLPSDIIASAPLRTDWGHEGRCHPRTRFARGSPSPSRSRGGRWLRPRRSTLRYIIAVAPLRTDSGPRRPLSSPNTLRTRFAVSEPFPRRKGTSSAPEAAERHHRVRAPSDGLGGTKAAVIPEHASHAVRRLRAVPAAGGGFDRAGAR